MSDVDGLLERLKCIAACESCKRGVGRAMNATDVLDIIATIEQQRAELQTYKTASSYWYVKCLMDRGHKVDPHSSSQHDDQVIRDMAAERRENKETIEQQRAEIRRLRFIVKYASESLPCGKCGARVLWVYAGDGTQRLDAATAEEHTC